MMGTIKTSFKYVFYINKIMTTFVNRFPVVLDRENYLVMATENSILSTLFSKLMILVDT